MGLLQSFLTHERELNCRILLHVHSFCSPGMLCGEARVIRQNVLKPHCRQFATLLSHPTACVQHLAQSLAKTFGKSPSMKTRCTTKLHVRLENKDVSSPGLQVLIKWDLDCIAEHLRNAFEKQIQSNVRKQTLCAVLHFLAMLQIPGNQSCRMTREYCCMHTTEQQSCILLRKHYISQRH